MAEISRLEQTPETSIEKHPDFIINVTGRETKNALRAQGVVIDGSLVKFYHSPGGTVHDFRPMDLRSGKLGGFRYPEYQEGYKDPQGLRYFAPMLHILGEENVKEIRLKLRKDGSQVIDYYLIGDSGKECRFLIDEGIPKLYDLHNDLVSKETQ